MIQLSFLGAIATVGASGLLVDTGSEKIVFDYGTKVKEVPPIFPILVRSKLNAALLSHAHLDHSGALPIFSANGNGCPIYALSVTRELVDLLLWDSLKISREEGVKLPFDKKDVKQTVKNFVPVDYREHFKIHTSTATAYDAGHIPGSAMWHLKTNGHGLLYTGDFNTEDTRLLKKADENLPKVHTLVTESTYAQRDHPNRKDQERQLDEIVRSTLAVDGVTVISGFAVGRIAEILLILDSFGIDYPLYIDGMSKKAITIENKHKQLLRDAESLDSALKNVDYVTSEKMRKKMIKEPCVILTTSGMLSGGPVIWYIKKLYDDRNASLVLTGYQVEDTPGRILLETGRFMGEGMDLEMNMLVKRLDFSSHLGRKQLLEFIKKLNPERVFCMHGDLTEEFATELREQGFNAIAPIANNRVFNIET
jgi:putative mRNA 3-end processing factor